MILIDEARSSGFVPASWTFPIYLSVGGKYFYRNMRTQRLIGPFDDQIVAKHKAERDIDTYDFS